jgi:hypothetical protein
MRAELADSPPPNSNWREPNAGMLNDKVKSKYLLTGFFMRTTLRRLNVKLQRLAAPQFA